MTIAQSKTDLRSQLRTNRRSLTAEQQQLASSRLLSVALPSLQPKKVKRLALYLAMDGELDLSPFIETCWERNIEVYLPILHRFRATLWFAQYLPTTPLYNNRFNIPEPLHANPIRSWQLNWVMLPLVGFDEHGGRLGMGGGFYDRTFAHMNRWPKKPKLFGVAHECQKVEQIPLESWDIRLDGVISDGAFY
jgi:5-formyltetrahydrofolate cyclo-ligase